jgi:hypothetical protein
MSKNPKFKRNDLVRPTSTTTKPDAWLGSVMQVQIIDMGQGRLLTKVQVLWLKGPKFGTTNIMDERSLVLATAGNANL